jgi:hypothetical protein
LLSKPEIASKIAERHGQYQLLDFSDILPLDACEVVPRLGPLHIFREKHITELVELYKIHRISLLLAQLEGFSHWLSKDWQNKLLYLSICGRFIPVIVVICACVSASVGGDIITYRSFT